MPRKSDAKNNLIEASIRLFQLQGYNGTGLEQLLRESEAPKGSFYHHFPGGKQELAVLAIERAGREINEIIERTIENRSPPEAVRALAKAIGDWFESTGFSGGCPITSVLLDTVPASKELHAVCRRVFENWEAILERHFVAQNMSAKEASLYAQTTIAAIEGAWIVSRAKTSVAPFKNVAEVIAYALETKAEKNG